MPFRRFIATLAALSLAALYTVPAQAGSLIPGTPFTLDELQIEAREACEDLRWRERRRCLREAEAAAQAQAERMAAMAPVALAYRRRFIEGLAAEGTPRSLAMAAVLASDTLFDLQTMPELDALRQPDPRVREWRDAALAASDASGRDDPLVLRLAYAASGGEEAVQRAVLARWRQQEPGNLQPILAEADLDRDTAFPRPDETAPLSPTLLAAAFRAEGYDDAFADLQRLALQALRRHPPSADELETFRTHPAGFDLDAAGLGLGIELWSAGPVVRFMPLMRSCDPEPMETVPGRRDDCRRLGRRMYDHGNSLIAQLVGVALLRKAAMTDEERGQARALRDRYEWHRQQMAKADISEGDNAPVWLAAQVARLLQDEHVTETQLVEAGLQALGLPTEPPPGWTSGYLFPDEREAE